MEPNGMTIGGSERGGVDTRDLHRSCTAGRDAHHDQCFSVDVIMTLQL